MSKSIHNRKRKITAGSGDLVESLGIGRILSDQHDHSQGSDERGQHWHRFTAVDGETIGSPAQRVQTRKLDERKLISTEHTSRLTV